MRDNNVYEVKMDPDDSGRVLLRDGARRGRWSRPVIDSKGQLHVSISEAAVAAGVHQSVMSRAISAGQEIDGVLYADALPSEVSRHVRIKEYIVEQQERGVLVAKAPEPKPLPEPTEPVWKAKTPAPSKPEPATFQGVVWPDGVVTVRLIPGDFVFTRASIDELPVEIQKATVWLNGGPR